jgi:tRNA ligase
VNRRSDYSLQWEALEHHTAPPYTLTLKSNGCIIFIAAISPDKVIVTSKHSLTSEHAEVGLEWLEKIVTGKGYTMEQFAATLWEKKWTAIAEVRSLQI